MLNAVVSRRFIALVAASLILMASGALAQTFLGSIIGVVTDSSGAVVPGAKVTVTETQTGVQRKVESNAEGVYSVADLIPGQYKVEVTSTGFRSLVSAPITLTTQRTARFDAQMQVGDVSQSVEVEAIPARVNTENAQLNDIRTRDDLITLPINTRSTTDFRYITSSNYEGGYLAGQRGSFGYYSIDGVSGMAPAWGAWSGPTMQMSIEAIQEINFVTSSPSAEYGDVATVYVGTRSGTNQVHGSGFYTHANNAFNARDFFAGSKPKGPTLHELGGSIGGPVYIPKVYHGKNRTFFFFSYERRKVPGTTSTTASVPTVKMREGDFSELLPGRQILDPTNRQPFAGNILPRSRMSPVSLAMEDPAYMAMPNFGPANGFVNNYRDVVPIRNASNLFSIRGDHTISSKDSISSRMTIRRDMENRYDTGLPTWFHYQYRNTRNAYLSETHLFSPTLINEFRFSWSRDHSPLHGLHNGAELVDKWGIQGLNLANKRDRTGTPQVNWTNFTRFFEYNSYSWAHETYEYLDNVSWTRGKHMIKMGGMFRRYRCNSSSSDSWADFGTYSFDGFASGFDWSDFLLGLPHTTGRFEQAPDRSNRYGYLAAYVQDDWRVSTRLTVNFGLRYEYNLPPIDTHDMRFAFDSRNGNLVVPNQKVIDTLVSPVFPKSIPIVTAASAGFPERALLYGDKKNWGPRIGFAWRPIEKTVIRGGYGVYYTPLSSTLLDPYFGGPFRSSENFTNTLTNGVPLFAFPRPFTTAGTVPTQSLTGVTLTPSMPYTHQWNLTIERQLPKSVVARISWRGHRVTQLLYSGNRNKPNASADPANANFYRYPNFATVTYVENGGMQVGHLIEAEFERKYASGLTFQFGYTFAKVLTDVPGGDVSGGIENAYDRRREYADDNGVTRHRTVSYAIYELPFGSGKHFGNSLPGWVRQTFGNWQTSAILALQSGRFITPSFSTFDPSNTRTFGGRADRIADWEISNPTIDRWFNPAAFAIPGCPATTPVCTTPAAVGRFGNSARNVMTGPGLVNFDFGLFKFFKLSEKTKLRADMTATNFFNHPNFGNPNTNISSSAVGRITGTNGNGLGGGARRIKLGLRFEF